MLMPLLTNSFIEHCELITSSLILLTSFIFLTQTRINNMINTFVWQSALLALAAVLEGIMEQHTALYFSAGIIVVLKVLFLPYLMRYLVKKLDIRHGIATITHPFLLLLGAVVLVLFCYHFIASSSAVSTLHGANVPQFTLNNVTAVAMAVTLLGMLILITHRKVIAHIIGFMAMENGIFFAALTAAHGMPMVVELGIAFDVLVAAVLFGVFFFHIRSTIDSLDVNRLNSLREDIQ
jgi:hydrogenase-4 component E